MSTVPFLPVGSLLILSRHQYAKRLPSLISLSARGANEKKAKIMAISPEKKH
jgi:hypothetical protein